MSLKHLVSGLLTTRLQAEVVVGMLENAGVRARDIAVMEPLGKDGDEAPEIGTLRSLVDVGMVAVPDLGVFAAHGLQASALAEHAGVLVASCAHALLDGAFLISVHVRTAAESARARKVLDFGGAKHILATSSRAQAA
jgi:hypothetical protein